MTAYDPKAAAARGAALLDERDPEWVAKMPEDLSKLTMRSLKCCVLGWWAGSFDAGLRRLDLQYAGDYGFDRPWGYYGDVHSWGADVADSWRELIAARRELVKA